MNLTPFLRLLEDVLREEVLTMGLDYDNVIESIIQKRDGELCTIRFKGEFHDLDIVEPEELPTRTSFAALIRRKLETALRRRGATN